MKYNGKANKESLKGKKYNKEYLLLKKKNSEKELYSIWSKIAN